MSFGQSEKDKLDLLYKKSLGFQFTDSDLSPAQQNLTNYYINNSLIFSDSIPTPEEGAFCTKLAGGTGEQVITPPAN